MRRVQASSLTPSPSWPTQKRSSVRSFFRFSCRSIDTAARYGGDEFAVVLPETGIEAANQVAQRICDGVANDGMGPLLSVSVGTAVYPEDGTTIESLLQAADRMLYKMKPTEKTS